MRKRAVKSHGIVICLGRKHELQEEIQGVRTVHYREKGKNGHMEYGRLLLEINFGSSSRSRH